MKAVILAGGRGKRMRPVTDYVPKPLVPVRSVPIMEWQIRYLTRFGIRDVIVCTGYKAGMIEDRIKSKDYGARIRVSVEDSPLGTGGAIGHAEEHLAGDDSFVVLNGDVITDIDLERLMRAKNAIAMIPLRTNYGVLDVGDAGADGACAVRGFDEKSHVRGLWMNAGVYHLEREVLADLPESGDIEKTIFPDYARRGILSAVRFGGDTMWQSIDSFKDLEACEKMIMRRTNDSVGGADPDPVDA